MSPELMLVNCSLVFSGGGDDRHIYGVLGEVLQHIVDAIGLWSGVRKHEQQEPLQEATNNLCATMNSIDIVLFALLCRLAEPLLDAARGQEDGRIISHFGPVLDKLEASFAKFVHQDLFLEGHGFFDTYTDFMDLASNAVTALKEHFPSAATQLGSCLLQCQANRKFIMDMFHTLVSI